MLEPWRTGIVLKTEDATPTTRRFWIQVPELVVFHFIPGQFVTLDLPIHEKRNKRWRSYSIASSPDGTNIFELIIVFSYLKIFTLCFSRSSKKVLLPISIKI